MFENVITYFSTLEQRPLERLAFLVVGLLFFWIMEGYIPLITMQYKKNKLKHAGVNFAFTVIHLIIHTFLALAIIKISDWCLANNFGLVYWIKTNVLFTILISFLILTDSEPHWLLIRDAKGHFV